MFKKITKKAICLLLMSAVLLTVCSCSTKPPAIDEVKETFSALIEASYEINGIIFGDEVETYDRQDEEVIKNGIYYNVPDGFYNYEFLTENNKYQTEDEIREATLKVYSEDYISSVLDSCFNGFMDESGETAVQPKYLGHTGKLMLNTEYEVYVTGDRRYDLDTMEIVKPSNGKIVNVSLDAIDGEERTKARLTFVLQDGEWRLDSPTY
ncbi:MAG: hypothetical protein IJC32_02880 [Clostridia bacterium]|nr:hypothetical protein [Clostridia bacterium]